MRKLIIVIMALALLATALPVQAADAKPDITLNVSGLVCDFCARAIEHVFRKQAAVKDVTVDLDNGRVTIDLNPGKTIDDKTLGRLMADSGYTVTGITRAKGAAHD
ncbi:MAG TPA: heavy metal-associated domain-containing protein [Patescibacteria group bacterium]|nr:heavy metal-associated domain-containing protein [Patescibacteria group bacterium]